jgi:hypothetical protein
VEEQQERDQEHKKTRTKKKPKKTSTYCKEKGCQFCIQSQCPISLLCCFYNDTLPPHSRRFNLLTAFVKDILTSLSNKRIPMIVTATDKLNLKVSSWDSPSHNIMTSVSSSLVEDNVDKNSLSSQSTFKDNIEDFDASGMI